MLYTLQVHDRTVRRLKKGIPVLQVEDFPRRARFPDPGAWIRIADMRNRLLALGLVDRDKALFCRVVYYRGGRGVEPDVAYFIHHAEEARSLREKVFSGSSTDMYRLLNAEGDGIPGVVLDRYGDFGVAWILTPGLKSISRQVCEAAMEVFGLKGVYEKGPPREGFHPEKGKPDRPVMGETAPDALTVREGEMRLEARLNEGPRTGIYPDQRENREHLASLVRGRRVLNTFSYTGAFSVHAALSGAEHTVSVDLSRRSLDWSERNFALNGIDLEDHLHVKADVFDYLKLARKKDLSFGVIILDPPTFSTSKRGMFRAGKDWSRLIRASLEVLEDGGWIAVSCNTRQIDEVEINRFIKSAGREAGRPLIVEETRGLPSDFPTHRQLPRMDYLKFILARCR
jgi:23S rRNA (cytosine1962-C5)-methyltransferase